MLFDRKGGTPEPAGGEGPEVTHHRNRLAGMWAAELLGLIGQAAHDYAREVAHAHEHTPDDERVISRLARDLHGKVTVHEIRDKLAHFLHEARRQLLEHKRK